MKIAIVVPGGLHPSGTEQIVPSWLRLFEQLAKTHEIHAFVLKHLSTPQSYSLRGFTVHDLGRPSSALGVARWAQERALLKALDAYRPFDLVHGFFADPSGLLAARAGERLGIPSIVTCDSGEFVALPVIRYGSQRTRRGRRAVLEACALAARVHVCTQFMAALATAHDVKTTIIPLTSVTSETAAARQLSRPAGDASFRLVQVASLSRVKNQRLLLDALAIVRKRIDARLDLRLMRPRSSRSGLRPLTYSPRDGASTEQDVPCRISSKSGVKSSLTAVVARHGACSSRGREFNGNGVQQAGLCGVVGWVPGGGGRRLVPRSPAEPVRLRSGGNGRAPAGPPRNTHPGRRRRPLEAGHRIRRRDCAGHRQAAARCCGTCGACAAGNASGEHAWPPC